MNIKECIECLNTIVQNEKIVYSLLGAAMDACVGNSVIRCLLSLLLILAIFYALFKIIRRTLTPTQHYRIGKAIGIFMLVQEVLDRLYHIIAAGEPVILNLPLHICGVSVVVVALLLISKYHLFFDFAYFAGLSGALQAALTPDIAFDFPHPLFVTYFSSHYLILIGVLYAVLVYGMRPNFKSLRNAVVLTHVYAVMIFGLNYVLDSNYLFLREKPETASLMNAMGPWPYYIAWLELSALLSFALLYLFSCLFMSKRERVHQPFNASGR